MKYSILQARAIRNMLPEEAGEHYRDINSPLIRTLNIDNTAYLGIQKDPFTYTVIGRHYVFFSSMAGKQGKILNSDFIDILSSTVKEKGKLARIDTVKLANGEMVWVKNIQIICILTNLLGYLVYYKERTE